MYSRKKNIKFKERKKGITHLGQKEEVKKLFHSRTQSSGSRKTLKILQGKEEKERGKEMEGVRWEQERMGGGKVIFLL